MPAAVAAFTARWIAEDRLLYNEPPDWLLPERERLGAVLLARRARRRCGVGVPQGPRTQRREPALAVRALEGARGAEEARSGRGRDGVRGRVGRARTSRSNGERCTASAALTAWARCMPPISRPASVLVLAPGATTAVVVRNTLAGGHRAGVQRGPRSGRGQQPSTRRWPGLGLWVLLGRWPAVLDAMRLGGAGLSGVARG